MNLSDCRKHLFLFVFFWGGGGGNEGWNGRIWRTIGHKRCLHGAGVGYGHVPNMGRAERPEEQTREVFDDFNN